jgi:drug/metabolite transporter (DMT)-like permease
MSAPAAGLVYALCAVTALACALLLLRGYRDSGARLLLWGGLCFVALTVNNLLLFVDLLLVPQFDLFTWRNVAALAGTAVLVWGLIWDAQAGPDGGEGGEP